MLLRDGEGHREADPSALADLVPDGGAAPGHGARDQAGGRGVLRDERRRVRAPLLRGPRGARVPGHRAEGRQARRGLLRGGELFAPTRELLPLGDRVHRRGAGRPAHAALAARRRVRLRGAAAARAAAAVVGQAVAARIARASQRGARHHGGSRRARTVPAAVEDRDGDLPPQDDPLRLLHDGPRRGGVAQGGPIPPAVPARPVLPRRLFA